MKYQKENVSKNLDFRSRPHGSWYMKPHLHDFSEIIYIKKGEGTITVNGRQIKLCEKQFAWIPPNFIHEYHLDNTESVCAVFSNDFIPLFFRASNNRSLVVSPINAEELASVLEVFYEFAHNHYLTISGYLNLIAAKVIEQSRFEDSGHIHSELLQKIIMDISSHYTEDISLSQLSKKFGYHEKYLSQTLHAMTGMHFTQFLSFYRIEHAKMLLTNQKESSIADIALQSGFSAINTFNRTFKKIVGTTPLEYRKKNQN